MLNVVNQLMSSLLQMFFGATGDWGIAIVILTLLVRIVLLPVAYKQKQAMESQLALSKQIEALKVQYKHDKVRLEAEMAKLSMKASKGILGVLLPCLQIPILYALYTVFTKMPTLTKSFLVPWLSNLSLPDPYLIIPILTVLAQLMPSLLVTAGMLKNMSIPKLSWVQVLTSGLMAWLFFAKAPVALGLYWVTSSVFTALEQILLANLGKKCL